MRTSAEAESRMKQEAARGPREEFWLNQSIEPEELLQLDPLDITEQMVEQAEHVELADYDLSRLPP